MAVESASNSFTSIVCMFVTERVKARWSSMHT
jgi:hypothetical protein